MNYTTVVEATIWTMCRLRGVDSTGGGDGGCYYGDDAGGDELPRMS